MPESDRPQAAVPETATAVPVTPSAEPRIAGEVRSFRADAPTYTFVEEHRAPSPSDEDRVSRR